jgi:hypothetical protein
VGYYFFNLTAKINHRFSEKVRIYLSVYMSDDKFHTNEMVISVSDNSFQKIYSNSGIKRRSIRLSTNLPVENKQDLKIGLRQDKINP